MEEPILLQVYTHTSVLVHTHGLAVVYLVLPWEVQNKGPRK